ncbi:hypothetical protein [Arcticibacter sp.]|uniref:hypothetical protein n=1 Tax=Arcticibacter sp. TaxID=1872630 RepID=UPI00388FB6A5
MSKTGCREVCDPKAIPDDGKQEYLSPIESNLSELNTLIVKERDRIRNGLQSGHMDVAGN